MSENTVAAEVAPVAPAVEVETPAAKSSGTAETLINKLKDVGIAWASVGLSSGKVALESTAKALAETAKSLDEITNKLKQS